MFAFPKRRRPKDANVRVGKPEASPTAPADAGGVKPENAQGNPKKDKGLKPDLPPG
jgi:hypothetical protein